MSLGVREKGSATFSWGTPVQIEGQDGQDGDRGPPGLPGQDGMDAMLTDGSVQTAHIALSATSDLFITRASGTQALSANTTASVVTAVSVPGGSGYEYIAWGGVLLTGSNAGSNPVTAHITGARRL